MKDGRYAILTPLIQDAIEEVVRKSGVLESGERIDFSYGIVTTPIISILEDVKPSTNPRDIRISDIAKEFTVRSYNALINSGLRTLGHVADTPIRELLKTKNFSRKSVPGVRKVLGKRGLVIQGQNPFDESFVEDFGFGKTVVNKFHRHGVFRVQEVVDLGLQKLRGLGKDSPKPKFFQFTEANLEEIQRCFKENETTLPD